MRFNTTINNVKAKEWGLNIQQAYLFAWFYELPSWASTLIFDNKIYYFASKNKAIEELCLLSDKIDTIYRLYKQIENKGLIDIKKFDSKDYVLLTEKAKEWNYKNDSDLNPTLGNLSVRHSDLNPTNNNINLYNNKIERESENFKNFENQKKSELKTQKEKEKKVAQKKEKDFDSTDLEIIRLHQITNNNQFSNEIQNRNIYTTTEFLFDYNKERNKNLDLKTNLEALQPIEKKLFNDINQTKEYFETAMKGFFMQKDQLAKTSFLRPLHFFTKITEYYEAGANNLIIYNFKNNGNTINQSATQNTNNGYKPARVDREQLIQKLTDDFENGNIPGEY